MYKVFTWKDKNKDYFKEADGNPMEFLSKGEAKRVLTQMGVNLDRLMELEFEFFENKEGELYVVRRFKEGVTLNGYEYLLTETQELQTFDSIEQANTFLTINDVPIDEVEVVQLSDVIDP